MNKSHLFYIIVVISSLQKEISIRSTTQMDVDWLPVFPVAHILKPVHWVIVIVTVSPDAAVSPSGSTFNHVMLVHMRQWRFLTTGMFWDLLLGGLFFFYHRMWKNVADLKFYNW